MEAIGLLLVLLAGWVFWAVVLGSFIWFMWNIYKAMDSSAPDIGWKMWIKFMLFYEGVFVVLAWFGIMTDMLK